MTEKKEEGEKLWGSLLYDAATNSLASDASSDNCWTKMVTASFAAGGHKEFQKELKDVEKLIKTEYKINAMPGPWRSAKSVVLSALEKGIVLTGANGEILGKSSIQSKLKAGKETDVDIFKKSLAACGMIRKHIESFTPAEKETIGIELAELLKICS